MNRPPKPSRESALSRRIDDLQAELARHTRRCEKCGNWLLPDEDSKDIYICTCCTANKMQKVIQQLQAELEVLKTNRDVATQEYRDLQAENGKLQNRIFELERECIAETYRATNFWEKLQASNEELEKLKEEGLKGNIPLIVLDQIKQLQDENEKLKRIIALVRRVQRCCKTRGEYVTKRNLEQALKGE